MFKKIVISFLIIAFLATAGGSFYWWQNQQDVREINKTLPQGIRVVKGWFNNEYKVVNNIDGYEFKVPKAWEGVEKLEYTTGEEAAGLRGAGVGVKGKNGGSTLLSIDVFYLDEKDVDLFNWSKELWESSGLVGNLTNDMIGSLSVVKGKEDVHLGGTYLYFLMKNKRIYIFNNGSEESIREIIESGKW